MKLNAKARLLAQPKSTTLLKAFQKVDKKLRESLDIMDEVKATSTATWDTADERERTRLVALLGEALYRN